MIKRRFQHSSRTIHEVLQGMMEFAKEVVRPTPVDANVSDRQRALRDIFPGALGALDGTLVHVVVPINEQTAYRGRGGGRYKYYLCDAAYANTRGFLAPYRNTRYWLADFRRRRALTKEEKFNHAHAQLKNVIERAYGVLKARKCNIQDHLFQDCDEDSIFNNQEEFEGRVEEEVDGTQWGTQSTQYMANMRDEIANRL
ncbi:hypothetical protein Tco_0298927 [Tanacetum coccineum]